MSIGGLTLSRSWKLGILNEDDDDLCNDDKKSIFIALLQIAISNEFPDTFFIHYFLFATGCCW